MLAMSNIDKQTSIINAFSGINKPKGRPAAHTPGLQLPQGS
jgi:hypothetical protein